MASGICPTRIENLSPTVAVGWGYDWETREHGVIHADPERPVWFYGVRDALPEAHPLRERFRDLEQLRARVAQLQAENPTWSCRRCLEWTTGEAAIAGRLEALVTAVEALL